MRTLQEGRKEGILFKYHEHYERTMMIIAESYAEKVSASPFARAYAEKAIHAGMSVSLQVDKANRVNRVMKRLLVPVPLDFISSDVLKANSDMNTLIFNPSAAPIGECRRVTNNLVKAQASAEIKMARYGYTPHLTSSRERQCDNFTVQRRERSLSPDRNLKP